MRQKQTLIILSGLPFSGKSTLAKYLSENYNFVNIDLDKINSTLGIGINKPVTEKQWKKTYEISYEQLNKYLKSGNSVVYDATNFTKNQRDKLRIIAFKYNIPAKTIYVNPPKDEVIKRWQENRIKKARKDVSDKDFAEVENNFEEPTEDENPLYFDQTKPISDWIKRNLR